MHLEILKPEQKKIFKKLKIFTLGTSVTLKDYVDLYFILKEKLMTLEAIISGCEKKYGDKFNGRLFLEQLVSVFEAEDAKIEFLKKPVDRGEMQSFFEKEIKKIKL